MAECTDLIGSTNVRPYFYCGVVSKEETHRAILPQHAPDNRVMIVEVF
jgi:dihydroorotase